MGNLCSPLPVLFGAGGFIGRTLASALPCLPLTSRDADFSDRSACLNLSSRLPKSAPWVLAATRSPDHCDLPAANMLNNIRMAENWGALAAACRPSAILFFSSIDVYGRNGLLLPLSEQSQLHPATPYAISKYVSEASLSDTCKTLDIPCAIWRLPGVFGPGDTHGGPVHRFVESLLQGDLPTIYGDGKQLRDLLFVEDLTALVRSWCWSPIPGLHNVVSGKAISVSRINTVLSQAAGVVPSAQLIAAPQIDLVFEPSQLWHALGVTPTPIETALRETYTRRRGSAAANEASRSALD